MIRVLKKKEKGREKGRADRILRRHILGSIPGHMAEEGFLDLKLFSRALPQPACAPPFPISSNGSDISHVGVCDS